jgi:hypothetical protein
MDDAIDNRKNISRNIVSFVLIFLTDPNSLIAWYLLEKLTDESELVFIIVCYIWRI